MKQKFSKKLSKRKINLIYKKIKQKKRNRIPFSIATCGYDIIVNVNVLIFTWVTHFIRTVNGKN